MQSSKQERVMAFYIHLKHNILGYSIESSFRDKFNDDPKQGLMYKFLLLLFFFSYPTILTHYHTMTPFDAPGKQAFCKTLWEKEKLRVTSNFSFSHSVFYPFR